jgi:hypothetical protein
MLPKKPIFYLLFDAKSAMSGLEIARIEMKKIDKQGDRINDFA